MLYVVTYSIPGIGGSHQKMVEAETGVDAQRALKRQYPNVSTIAAMRHSSSKGMPVGTKTRAGAFRKSPH